MYTVQILPLSITRWITFVTLPHGISLAKDPMLGGYAPAHLISRFIFRLSGLINVILLVTTRPNILLLGSSRGVLAHDDPRAIAEIDQRPVEAPVDFERSDLYLPQFDGNINRFSGCGSCEDDQAEGTKERPKND